MVRTRDTAAGTKAVGAKAPRKITPAASSSDASDSAKKNKYAGGNPYQPRETPSWQKPITNFFTSKAGETNGENSSSTATITSGALEESEKTLEESTPSQADEDN